MTKIDPYTPSVQNSSGSDKGSANNPYTQEEYEQMLDNGTWNGGYVVGIGYVLDDVVINESSNDDKVPISNPDSSKPDSSKPDSSFPDSKPGSSFPDSSFPGSNTGQNNNRTAGISHIDEPKNNCVHIEIPQ